MRVLLLLISLFNHPTTIQSGIVSFGIIQNVSLKISQSSSITVNGTCQTCLCTLSFNTSLFAFNCFSANLTCEMYSKVDQNKSFSLVNSATSALYLVSLSTYQESGSTVSSGVEQSSMSTSQLLEYLWTFDSTFQDLSSTFNTIPINSPNFSSTSITGYGSSLSLLTSFDQSLNIPNPQLKLNDQSWTFEAWIYLTNIVTGTQYAIIGQCRNNAQYECLHLLVRSRKLYLGFYSDDLSGRTNLTASKWYHVAFVFDCDNLTQSVYLDGVIDGTRQTSVCFQGRNQSLTIGIIEVFGVYSCFDGLIDQLSYTNRAKNSTEILRDATLVVHFPFDSYSIYDQGPLRINGSLAGNATFVSGRIGQALEIKNVNQSSFEVHGLVLLGVSNRSYSFSIWIRPDVQQKSVIIHLSSQSNGAGWCLPALGLTSSGQLTTYSNSPLAVGVVGPVVPIASWTHAAVTYSVGNGLVLYINGTLTNSLAPFSFVSGGQAMHLFMSSPSSGISCVSGYNISGSYSGAVDELRVYSRELSASDVVALVNP